MKQNNHRRPEFIDSTIIALKEKCKERQVTYQQTEGSVLIASDKISLHRELLFGGNFSMMLPDTMRDMDSVDRIIKYRNQSRPKVIKTDFQADVTISFNLLQAENVDETENVDVQMQKIRDDLRKIFKQNVFYDIGEVMTGEISIAWMDYRSFCIDGSLYNLLFLVQIEGEMLLGHFHCSFLRYDVWKPVILKLLETVQVDIRN